MTSSDSTVARARQTHPTFRTTSARQSITNRLSELADSDPWFDDTWHADLRAVLDCLGGVLIELRAAPDVLADPALDEWLASGAKPLERLGGVLTEIQPPPVDASR